MLHSLLVQPGIDKTEGYLLFPGEFRLLVKGDLWTSWSQNTSKLPLYILEAMSDDAHDMDSAPVMYLSEQIIDRDQTFVLEEISTKVFIFLQTSCNESEIAIPCTGRIAKGGHSLTILGPVQWQTQYLTDIPIGLLTEQVYNFEATSLSGPYGTGDRVKYARGLKTVDSTSSIISAPSAVSETVHNALAVSDAFLSSSPRGRSRACCPHRCRLFKGRIQGSFVSG